MASAPQPSIGVRQQRKLDTRQRLLDAATRQFEERGYDNVTVAEIAAEAGVSVKTLFQHFRAKEDLLIAEISEIHDEMIDAMRTRAPGTTPLQSVTDWVVQYSARRPADGLERWMRMVGTGPAILSMRRRLYDEWENALVEVLADEANEARPTPRTRLIAAQLICMIRVLTSPEVRGLLERYPLEERNAANTAWVLEAAGLLAGGLDQAATITGAGDPPSVAAPPETRSSAPARAPVAPAPRR
jgi:AcrR family transcriptional regulator